MTAMVHVHRAMNTAAVPQGNSINFDAQALHDADEVEYQQEELERQREVTKINFFVSV